MCFSNGVHFYFFLLFGAFCHNDLFKVISPEGQN
jgi:hypothetical protein